jgi:sec-independent protein translocase protein TatC
MPKHGEEADQPDEMADEEGGGPVKSFLEHLEDLRWTLIKCSVVVLVSMLVCFVAANRIAALLEWPLHHAQIPGLSNIPFLPGTESSSSEILLYAGSNVWMSLPPAALGFPTNSSNQIRSLHVQFVPNGTNSFSLVAVPDTNTVASSKRVPVLKNYTPMGGLMVALKLAIYGGIIFSLPFLLYFVGQFVLPALKVTEKKILFRAVAFGTILFFLGVAFCYFIISGVALMATVQFSQWMGFGADEWKAEDYISFMCRFMLGMGLAFELPVVILTLVKINLLDYKTLVRFRIYAVVGNLVLAAIATPSGDPFTMVLMAIPLQFLYEISVLIARSWARKDAAANP